MASGECETVEKRRKIADTSDDIFDFFFTKCDLIDTFLKQFKNVLTSVGNALIPGVIRSCDAGFKGRIGIPFHQSDCIVEDVTTQQFFLGSFFTNGIKIYNSLKQRKVPEDEVLKVAAQKLLQFSFFDKEWHQELKKINEDDYVSEKTQVMVTVAEHFFNRLSLCKGYKMDKQENKGNICKCGKCTLKNLHFDDTSIGNRTIWHGNVDILFDSCDVGISLPDIICKSESPGGQSCIEEEKEDMDHIQPRSQVIAQTIVFAFLQKQRHPSSKFFLIPTLRANNKAFKIFFYDPENDILLESRHFDFLSSTLEALNYESTIAAWLVLNHKILGTGPYKEFLDMATKSNFKDIVEETLYLYENELTMNVFENGPVEKCPKPLGQSFWFDLLKNDDANCIWPLSLPQPD